MSFQRPFSTIFPACALVLGALAGGCASPSAPRDTEADDIHETHDPISIISLNSLPPGLLMAPDYQVMMASLASHALGTATPLADTPSGRTLLAYIAVCALPEDVQVTIPGTGTSSIVVNGHIGLAPTWQTGALGSTDKRWISACLLAHANAYGAEVEIELRGGHPALVPSTDPGFSEEEAAFYGDLFQTGVAFACIGAAKSNPDGPPARVCGRTSECAFGITGTCPGTTEAPAACGDGPPYSECLTRTPGVTIDEVITVYTRKGKFMDDKGCTHPPDEAGWPLDRSCSSLIDSVCAVDPYCCDVDWDAPCVDLAGSIDR